LSTQAPPRTDPKLPPGESPLDPRTLHAFLACMSEDMILVGGQALSFWMQRFHIEADGMAISNDGDALGEMHEAMRIAQTLGAHVVVPRPTALTALNAQIRVPTPGAHAQRNIDLLHLLYTTSGLAKSHEFTARVRQNAVKIELEPGLVFKVMHPLDVLESRAHNAVGLVDDKGPHVVTQARWGIAVGAEALRRAALAQKFGAERLGALVQRLIRLARSSVGRRLLAEHGLDVLEAVDVPFLRQHRPEIVRQLEQVTAARDAA
jgi:hypothetical protein